jgi:hypothetical protein
VSELQPVGLPPFGLPAFVLAGGRLPVSVCRALVVFVPTEMRALVIGFGAAAGAIFGFYYQHRALEQWRRENKEFVESEVKRRVEVAQRSRREERP